jgi:teichuronic acid biosynthesis glycosyltransferase TuaH
MVLPLDKRVSSVRRRILYLMHVDWRWIKQRPQFLAESLSVDHDLYVLHKPYFSPGAQLTFNRSVVSPSELLPIPWSWRCFRRLTTPMQQGRVALAARGFRPDTIWLTHPSLVEMLPEKLAGLPIVYDCMDDALGFPASKSRRELLVALERRTVSRATLIICSSERLCELLKDRYGLETGAKISLVRNGVSSSLVNRVKESAARPTFGRRLRFAYIGTIAEWFDFSMLLAALDRIPDIEFHLIGPVAVKSTPYHERLVFHGSLAHDKLAARTADFDAFVMPFQVGPLVEAVDPVKLYEYMAFGKEIITVRYKEIERFSQFVHFYRTLPEFLEVIGRFAARTLEPKSAAANRSAFLAQSTWHARCSQICQLLVALNAGARA